MLEGDAGQVGEALQAFGLASPQLAIHGDAGPQLADLGAQELGHLSQTVQRLGIQLLCQEIDEVHWEVIQLHHLQYAGF